MAAAAVGDKKTINYEGKAEVKGWRRKEKQQQRRPVLKETEPHKYEIQGLRGKNERARFSNDCRITK